MKYYKKTDYKVNLLDGCVYKDERSGLMDDISEFASAHPVFTGMIVTPAIVVYGAILIMLKK